MPCVSVNYPDITKDIKPGDTVLVDSGLIRLEALKVTKHMVRLEVLTAGSLGSRRHINLPGLILSASQMIAPGYEQTLRESRDNVRSTLRKQTSAGQSET